MYPTAPTTNQFFVAHVFLPASMRVMDTNNLRINIERLLDRLDQLAQIGKIDGDGVCRLALTDEDGAGRDLVCSWMRDMGLAVTIDQAGNVLGTREGSEDGPVVLTGSHIDTVGTGGRYDGTLGVLAGLEVIACLNDAGLQTKAPLGVGFFTNEEGVRFQPDMMGSMVHQGHLPLDGMLKSTDRDGAVLAEELKRIGYAGEEAVDVMRAAAFVELHVEQGPVLERENITIGAVDSVQGLLWKQYTFTGTSNHAGTTPMSMRHDCGYAAGEIATFARRLANDMGEPQVATVGTVLLTPNLINVIAKQSIITVDLRNTDLMLLREAEARMDGHANRVAKAEGLEVEIETLARYDPTPFDQRVVDLVASNAEAMGYSVRQMPSGAGHDAQAFAPNCPTAMIFVPSVGGISHNVAEFTSAHDLEAGTNVLLHTLVTLANGQIDLS
jgi:beta-ureidopropionase / N-carbamoyl-L-amino-acid hydrolase